MHVNACDTWKEAQEIANSLRVLLRDRIYKLKKAGLIVLEGIKKHPKIAITLAVAASAVAIGGGVITGFRKRRKTVRAFNHIAPVDLEYVLLANGLCLKTAQEYMDEVEYYKYFQNKMRVINLFKKKS